MIVENVSNWTIAWISAGAALTGALIGAVASAGTQVFLSRQNRIHEKASVAAAIAAEIESVLRMVNRRDPFGRADQLVAAWEAGHIINMAGFSVPENPEPARVYPIFHGSVGKLGLLGHSAGDVTTFYSYILAIQATGEIANRGGYDHLTLENRIKFVREEIGFLREAVALGTRVARELRQLA